MKEARQYKRERIH